MVFSVGMHRSGLLRCVCNVRRRSACRRGKPPLFVSGTQLSRVLGAQQTLGERI